jgi:hypothetical protein
MDCWVYVFTDGTHYKIGHGNVDARLRAGQTWSPLGLKEICRIRCEDGEVLERRIHNRYQHRRINQGGTEWFALNESELKELLSYEECKSAFDWAEAAAIRQIPRQHISQTGTHRKSLLDGPRRSLHPSNKPLLVAVRRKHEVSCEDVLREERQADCNGGEQLAEHPAARTDFDEEWQAVPPRQLRIGFSDSSSRSTSAEGHSERQSQAAAANSVGM